MTTCQAGQPPGNNGTGCSLHSHFVELLNDCVPVTNYGASTCIFGVGSLPTYTVGIITLSLGPYFIQKEDRGSCYPLYPSLFLFPVSLTAICSALPLYHLYASNCRHVAYVQPSPQWKQAVHSALFILIRAIHTCFGRRTTRLPENIPAFCIS